MSGLYKSEPFLLLLLVLLLRLHLACDTSLILLGCTFLALALKFFLLYADRL